MALFQLSFEATWRAAQCCVGAHCLYCFYTLAKRVSSGLVSGLACNNQVKQHFSPEFINRVDDFIVFRGLSREEIKKIVVLQARVLLPRRVPLHGNLVVTKSPKEA